MRSKRLKSAVDTLHKSYKNEKRETLNKVIIFIDATRQKYPLATRFLPG
ncbi:MAG: hypothetical protein HOL31_01210 [Candidatus Scalindua sp.]|nr:hypothetical protein [Candidatus Scalindua sp.]MBT7592368.1 hypothetical protein [Candidatus Scalindua sp.]